MARDRSNWPWCLLWHGRLLGLRLAGERDPWAASLGQLADRSLEQALGAHPADDAGFWTPPMEIGEHPCVWLDGSLEVYPTVFFFSVFGAGVCLPAPEWALQGAIVGRS